MTIYVCERYHDNDCGIFLRLDAALAHLDECRSCEVIELVLEGNTFISTGKSVRWTECDNCGVTWRTDNAPASHVDSYCSMECQKETLEFYENGGVGIYGKNTRQMKEHIVKSVAEGKDPMKGCNGTGTQKELTWCPIKIDA